MTAALFQACTMCGHSDCPTPDADEHWGASVTEYVNGRKKRTYTWTKTMAAEEVDG